jgi:hypothetical protein
VVRVSQVTWRGVTSTLRKPLQLSTGPLTKHRGLLLTITSEAVRRPYHLSQPSCQRLCIPFSSHIPRLSP